MINTTLLSQQWSKVCTQQTMPGNRNSIAYSYVHIVLALRLLGVTLFLLLCSVLNRCWGFTAKLQRCKGNSKFTRASKLLGVGQSQQKWLGPPTSGLAQPFVIKLKLHSCSGPTREGCSRCAAPGSTIIQGTMNLNVQTGNAIMHKVLLS